MTHHKHAAHKIKYPWTKIRLKKACKRIRLRHSALSHNTRKTCNVNWQEQRLWQSKKPCFATHIGIKNGVLNCKKLPSQCKKSIYGKAFCRKLHLHTPRLTIKKGTNHTHFFYFSRKVYNFPNSTLECNGTNQMSICHKSTLTQHVIIHTVNKNFNKCNLILLHQVSY